MKYPSNMNHTVADQRADKVLFIWLLFAGWFGVLMGVPWSMDVLRDHPTARWWWEAAGDFLFFISASAVVGVRLDR